MVLSICTNYSLLIHIIIWLFWAYINKHVLSSYITTTISSMSGLFKWIILSSYLKHNPFWAHIFKNRWQFVQHVRFEQSCISSCLFFCSLKVLKTASSWKGPRKKLLNNVLHWKHSETMAKYNMWESWFNKLSSIAKWKADLINCHLSQNGLKLYWEMKAKGF